MKKPCRTLFPGSDRVLFLLLRAVGFQTADFAGLKSDVDVSLFLLKTIYEIASAMSWFINYHGKVFLNTAWVNEPVDLPIKRQKIPESLPGFSLRPIKTMNKEKSVYESALGL